MGPHRSTRGRRGLSILEVILAGTILALLLGVLFTLGRHFLFSLTWTGETFTIAREAGTIVAALRRDLERVKLSPDGLDLAVQLGGGAARDRKTPGPADTHLALSMSVRSDAGDRGITYRFDPLARTLFRQVAGGEPQALARGILARVSFGRFFVHRSPGGVDQVLTTSPAPYRPRRAGLVFGMAFRGRDKPVAAHPGRTTEFSTTIVPFFPNLRLSSAWRTPGDK